MGLLMIRALSQYDMRSVLQKKVSPFYSASLGSIQVALKKLENNRHVECHETIVNGRRKKVYSISELGKRHLRDWMLGSSIPSRFEQDLLTRLFFLGMMTASERVAIVRAAIEQLKSTLFEFEAVAAEAHRQAVPAHLQQHAVYQLKTLDLGLHNHRHTLEWLERLCVELEANVDEHTESDL
ncbi:PadR family transcriptional regulator [Cohnella cholangitidis]|uniref:PadR family transcriptional regulator n=1 Tax=Cohnella cholangitidis TaxID=2598458 RepID=UPI0015FAD81C|nr:helix-turn-helix transcriptional regulator [Cohnella cholangitidis]